MQVFEISQSAISEEFTDMKGLCVPDTKVGWAYNVSNAYIRCRMRLTCTYDTLNAHQALLQQMPCTVYHPEGFATFYNLHNFDSRCQRQ